MKCRNCQCPVEPWRFGGQDEGYAHVCTADHHSHDHVPEPDKRINTQPIKGEK